MVAMEAEQFDIIVFGGGKAGKNIALIERKYLGGSCINVACIPSKTLIASARRYHGGPAELVLARTGSAVSEMVAFNCQLFDASGLH
jgi:pyruvate/2-oxoglutarate dehydrogenase complex dihydrolipoamide dehydrogenase (E3) component